jgi:hypothetical protein
MPLPRRIEALLGCVSVMTDCSPSPVGDAYGAGGLPVAPSTFVDVVGVYLPREHGRTEMARGDVKGQLLAPTCKGIYSDGPESTGPHPKRVCGELSTYVETRHSKPGLDSIKPIELSWRPHRQRARAPARVDHHQGT